MRIMHNNRHIKTKPNMMLSINERHSIRRERAENNLWQLYLYLPYGFFGDDEVIEGKLYSANPEE